MIDTRIDGLHLVFQRHAIDFKIIVSMHSTMSLKKYSVSSALNFSTNFNQSS